MGGPLKHAEWLAEGSGDPRAALAHALVDALRGARTIVVYHAPFEIGRLRELQEAVPELAEDLEDIIDRVVDLLPIVRAYVYHPDFRGSFSLKRVAPALVVPIPTLPSVSNVIAIVLPARKLRAKKSVVPIVAAIPKALPPFVNASEIPTPGAIQVKEPNPFVLNIWPDMPSALGRVQVTFAVVAAALNPTNPELAPRKLIVPLRRGY